MSIKCNFVSTLPYVPSCDGEVADARRTGWIAKPCNNEAIVVRYSGGIIVEGYCETHCDEKHLSLHPWPNSGWERYNPVKHYSGGEV